MSERLQLKKVFNLITKQKAVVVIAVILIYMTFASPYFWNLKNMHDLVLQTSTYGVLLAGTTFILICGGVDLSQGGNFCLSGITVILLCRHFPLPIAILAALAVGFAIGCVNAFLVVYQGAEPFIITLGFGFLIKGICKVLTNAKPITGTNEFYKNFGTYRLFGVSIIIYIFIALVIISSYVLSRTQFGRNIYAIGGNFVVAEYSGINARRVKVICYIVSGVIGALGGILFSARMNSGSSNYGEFIPLMVNCSAVIGGTSFNGGSGNVVKSISGILLFSLLEISMNLLNISTYTQMVTKGLLIVAIVALDSYSIYKKLESAK